jgi:hypothetical protein
MSSAFWNDTREKNELTPERQTRHQAGLIPMGLDGIGAPTYRHHHHYSDPSIAGDLMGIWRDAMR